MTEGNGSNGSGSPVLSVEGLSVSYGHIRALSDVSFVVHKGEAIGILGANGAGKSTLLKAISRLVEPRSGKITLLGQDLSEIPSHKIVTRGIAHVPERRRVFSSLSVYDNLLMGAFTRSSKREVRATLDEVYELFPRLGERAKQLAGSLSGGEQQMLAVGRALMSQPTILMLDEPSLGLAPIVVEQMFDRIQLIHRELGLTIILVEQNAAEALEVIDRGLALETGEVRFVGTAAQLASTASLRQAYLGI